MQSVLVPLNKGKTAIIDEDDLNKVSKFKWYADHQQHTTYARCTKKKCMKMHRLILNAKKGQICDHINGDGLDNRKSNLRICSVLQNNMNSRLSKNNTSGFKGVSFHKWTKKWVARIGYKRKHISCGYFNSKIEAALAYDKKALELYGMFARLNFPKTIVKNRVKNVIESSRGRIIKVAFDKRSTGSERIMLCRTGVQKKKNGKGLSFDPEKYGIVIVYDMQKKMYRAIPLEGIKAIWINHNKFKVA